VFIVGTTEGVSREGEQSGTGGDDDDETKTHSRRCWECDENRRSAIAGGDERWSGRQAVFDTTTAGESQCSSQLRRAALAYDEHSSNNNLM
jgi:hypothetical protein